MINLTRLKDFKELKGTVEEEIILKSIKDDFVDFLDHLEEAESIEKYGKFIFIDDINDWKYEEGFLGISEGILKCTPENTTKKIIHILNQDIIIYRTLILFNNDYGIDIYYQEKNCPKDIFDRLNDEENMLFSDKYDVILNYHE